MADTEHQDFPKVVFCSSTFEKPRIKRIPCPRWSTLARLVLLVGVALAALGLSLTWLAGEGQAQDGIEVNKTLEGSQTVRVGEVLTFHISIRNSTSFSLTTVPLTDVFRADILSSVPTYVDPPYDSLTYVGNTGVISWTDIATHFGGFIIPGQTVTVTLAFIAEHPTQQLTIVNQAGVHDAINIRGESVFAGSDEAENDAVGGSAPVTKTLDLNGDTPEVGLPVTFTIQIRNDGAAAITYLPLEDNYDPSLLAFHYAVPDPTLVVTQTGVISWADLTLFFGPIPGDTTITVTTVYTLISDSGVQTTTNQARVAGAQDEYSNELAPGQDYVPIQILFPATATPTPAPSEDDDEDEDEATPTPTPTSTPAPTHTPIPIPTPTATLEFPSTLPETGTSFRGWGLVVAGLLLALGGGALYRGARLLKS
jgi:uncharacterized repeat protein (TIGR01451 family)/LPXTG-motif cell wall-anchored protein